MADQGVLLAENPSSYAAAVILCSCGERRSTARTLISLCHKDGEVHFSYHAVARVYVENAPSRQRLPGAIVTVFFACPGVPSGNGCS